MEEANEVFLSDGRKLVLEDDDDIILSFISNDKTEDTFQFPEPSGGYGGGSLKLSPSEKYLIFSYFSGESEEAFSLFELKDDRLTFLYDSGYLYGEEAEYSFADDEKLIVQTFRTDTWYEENAQADENGDRYYEFGELNLFYPESRSLERHAIRVYPAEDWEEEKTDVGPFLFSSLDAGVFHLVMPWGEETFYEPLPEILTVRFEGGSQGGSESNGRESFL